MCAVEIAADRGAAYTQDRDFFNLAVVYRQFEIRSRAPGLPTEMGKPVERIEHSVRIETPVNQGIV